MDASQAWIVLTLVGVLTGLTASVVEIGTAWLVDLRHGRCLTDLRLRKALCCVNSTNGSCPEWVPWTDSNTSPRLTTLTFTLSGTLLATLSTLLVTLFAHKYHTPQGSVQSEYYAAGSGIPQVKTILGGFILRGCLGLQTLLAKTLALVPAIASGLMIGEQGPIVHISVSIGNVVSRLYHKYNVNEGKRREMLSAASAAGVAVAFGAPLGGVLFALEEVSYYFPMKTLWRTFYCALCAAFTLRLMNPFGAGKLVKFQVVSNHPWQTFEIGPFVLLGLVGGLYGGLFIRLVRLLGRLETVHFSSVQRKMIRVVVVATCTGLLSSLNPLTRLSNVDLILQLFTDCSTPTASSSHSTLLLCSHTSTTTSPLVTLIWTWVVKVVLMTAAFGLHVPGGVFIPCMVIGALNGHILFRLMTPLTPSHSTLFTLLGVSAPPVSPTLYAMLGSASVISGVTRMTVSLSIIMFELTGGSTLHYVVPLMLSVMVAKWVGDAFEAVSVYEMVIQGRGYPYLDHKKTHLVKSGSGGVEEVMDVGVQTLGVEREYGFDEVQEKMAAACKLFMCVWR